MVNTKPWLLGLMLALTGAALAFPAGQEPERRDAQAILQQVRQANEKLTAYRFEHRIRIDQAPVGGAQENVADVALTTVTQVRPASGGRGQAREAGSADPAGNPLTSVPFDAARCRLESVIDRGRLLLVSGDGSTAVFSSANMEYMKGETLADVTRSVAGSMLIGLHLVPLVLPAEQAVQDARIIGEETLTIENERRACDIIDITVKPGPAYAPSPGKFTMPTLADMQVSVAGAVSYIGVLRTFGFVNPQGLDTYNPTSAPRTGPHLTVWVDRERLIVVRRRLVETAARIKGGRLQGKPTGVQQPREPEEVQIELTDVYSVAMTNGPLPDTLFRFEPPPGAKEIPNIRKK